MSEIGILQLRPPRERAGYDWLAVGTRTNLIATVWEFNRLVPAPKRAGQDVAWTARRRGWGVGVGKAERTLKDDAEGALSDLLANAVVDADDVGGGGRGVRVGHLSNVGEGGDGEGDDDDEGRREEEERASGVELSPRELVSKWKTLQLPYSTS